MKKIIAALTLACALTFPGCVDGKFDPATAGVIVSSAAAPACTMLGISLGDQSVGAVCEDVAGMVSSILSKIKLSSIPFVGEAHYVGVSFDRRVVGFVRSDVAPQVQSALDERAGMK